MPKIRPYSSQSCITQLDFPTAESVAAWWGTFSSPHSFHSGAGSQRPGAVKGAPFFGAAKRTLDGEDRCETITEGRKAPSSNSAYPLQSLNSLLLSVAYLLRNAKYSGTRIAERDRESACVSVWSPCSRPGRFGTRDAVRMIAEPMPPGKLSVVRSITISEFGEPITERHITSCLPVGTSVTRPQSRNVVSKKPTSGQDRGSPPEDVKT
jgi:hypothetical protein